MVLVACYIGHRQPRSGMLAEAVWETGTTGRYPRFQKASAYLTFVRLGILANAWASAMAPSGPPLPIELFLRLWCRVARMVKHGERHHELIQGSIRSGRRKVPRRALERGDTRRREDLGQLENGAHIIAVVAGELVVGEAARHSAEPESRP